MERAHKVNEFRLNKSSSESYTIKTVKFIKAEVVYLMSYSSFFTLMKHQVLLRNHSLNKQDTYLIGLFVNYTNHITDLIILLQQYKFFYPAQ